VVVVVDVLLCVWLGLSVPAPERTIDRHDLVCRIDRGQKKFDH